MDIEAAVEEIEAWAESDWIGLWEIVQYATEVFRADEPQQQLELTVLVVTGLLKRGLCAGDSPVQNTGDRFVPWRSQDPDAIAALIRREWNRNHDYPTWGDGPWFTVARLCRLDA